MKRTKWLGSDVCDICHAKIVTVLYDAKTVYGPWATMCPRCWKDNTYQRLGVGLGQKYVKNEDGDFIKEEV